MKFLLGVVTTLVVIILVIGTALGIVPVLSPLVGAGPKDLGIHASAADAKAAKEKVGTEIIYLPAGTDKSKDYTFEGKQNEDFTMDSKELTAYANNDGWANYPFRALQIKIHDDGTLEGTGILVVSKAIPYATALGYSEEQIRDAMKKYNIPPFEVPFYVNGSGSVTNNRVSINATTVKIGFVTVPGSIVSQANHEAANVLEDVIRKRSASLNAESLTFENGSMHFKGQSPLKEYLISK
jgi:hypothetical protein